MGLALLTAPPAQALPYTKGTTAFKRRTSYGVLRVNEKGVLTMYKTWVLQLSGKLGLLFNHIPAYNVRLMSTQSGK